MKKNGPPSQLPMPPGMASTPDVTDSLVDRALSQFKIEVAGDIGLPLRNRSPYGGHMTTRETGHLGGPIGGEMVRRMVKQAEKNMAGRNPPL